MDSVEVRAREALRQIREFFEVDTDPLLRSIWPRVCETAGGLGVDLSDPMVRRTFLIAEQVLATHQEGDAEAGEELTVVALIALRTLLIGLATWPDMLAETCGMCGRTPAEGMAQVGGVRYCHGDATGPLPEPTCYMKASWRAVPMS